MIIDVRVQVRMAELIKQYLLTQPCGLYKYSTLKEAHSQLARQLSETLPAGCTPTAWAGDVAERMLVVLNHVRRLQNPTRFKQACCGLSEAQCETLQQLVDLLDTEAGSSPASEAHPSSEGRSDRPPTAKRLKAQVSEVSLDSDGLPSLDFLMPPSSPAPAPSSPPQGHRLLEEAQACSPLPCRKQDIRAMISQAAADLQSASPKVPPPTPASAESKAKSKAKAQAKAASKTKAKTAPKAKATALHHVASAIRSSRSEAAGGKRSLELVAQAALEQQSSATGALVRPRGPQTSLSFGAVYLTLGAQKSYISAIAKLGDHKTLLVNCTAMQDSEHQKVMLKVFEFCRGAGLTKKDVWYHMLEVRTLRSF